LKVTREDPAAAEDLRLRLFFVEDICERTGASVSYVRRDVADPACPLKWTHQVGKRRACDAAMLACYLEWLRIDRVEERAAGGAA
jgi:hypothetical protein